MLAFLVIFEGEKTVEDKISRLKVIRAIEIWGVALDNDRQIT